MIAMATVNWCGDRPRRSVFLRCFACTVPPDRSARILRLEPTVRRTAEGSGAPARRVAQSAGRPCRTSSRNRIS
jgi:hypothetical protein